MTPLVAWACSTSAPSGQPVVDAGPEAATDARADQMVAIPDPDASTRQCLLLSGNDPIGFCEQKDVLRATLESAYAEGVGVYASWDSKTFLPDKSDAGALVRDFHDDLGIAAALANYHASAIRYGDNEVTALFDATLLKLEKVIEADLTPLPREYGGDVYRQLRTIAGTLRTNNRTDEALRIDALAEAYARAIYTNFAQSGDAGANDTILGVVVAPGQIAYEPASVATAALALLDMAQRHAADEPANATNWQNAAVRSLDHLLNRARDPVTKLYYRALVTSTDADHDALAVSTSATPSDALLLEVQAAIALNLARAQELVTGSPVFNATVKAYPFETNADALITAMNGPPISLWDGPQDPDAGVGGGYFEGYVPSTGAMLTNKPTRGNALAFAAIHRVINDTAGPLSWQLRYLRTILTKKLPVHSSLYSVVADQSALLRASSQGFDLATLFAPDGGPGAPEPRAASYNTAAVAAACEGFNEIWYRWQF